MLHTASSSTLDDILQATRFSPITDNDQAGILWIASLLSGVYALLSLILRFYIKRHYLGHDDWICLAATIIGAGSFAAVFVGLSHGLGKSFVRDPMRLQEIGQAVFASRLTFIIAVASSKGSVIFLIRRLFSQDMSHHLMLCNIVLATTLLWMLGALIALLAECSSRGLVDDNADCRRQLLRWEFIGIFDAINELLIVLLSGGLVWRLQMRFQLKVRVVVAFTFRLPLVAVAAIHVYYISTVPSEDLNLHIIPALALEEIQLGYALLSATIPNLKSFVMSFDTGMMMDFADYHVELATKAPSTSFPSSDEPLTSFKHNQYSGTHADDAPIGALRPERLEHHATAHCVKKADSWESRGPEDEIAPLDRSIRREMQWKSEEEIEGYNRI